MADADGLRRDEPSSDSQTYLGEVLGFLLSLGSIFGLPGMALDREWTDPWWSSLVAAIVLVLAAWVVGLLFVRTVGIGAVGLVIGGAIAAVLAPFAGNGGHSPGFVAMALAGVVIGNGQKHRMAGYV